MKYRWRIKNSRFSTSKLLGAFILQTISDSVIVTMEIAAKLSDGTPLNDLELL